MNRKTTRKCPSIQSRKTTSDFARANSLKYLLSLHTRIAGMRKVGLTQEGKYHTLAFRREHANASKQLERVSLRDLNSSFTFLNLVIQGKPSADNIFGSSPKFGSICKSRMKFTRQQYYARKTKIYFCRKRRISIPEPNLAWHLFRAEEAFLTPSHPEPIQHNASATHSWLKTSLE